MKRSAPRKRASLSESLQQQLNRYALAAIAAGIGVSRRTGDTRYGQGHSVGVER